MLSNESDSKPEKIVYQKISDDFDLSFKVYHDLMARRVSEILLVSSAYDAFIMEEDGRLAERIIHEYRGLNLTRPPRVTWVPDTKHAFVELARKRFDLILTMPRLDDLDPYLFGKEIKQKYHNLPVFLLTHGGSAVVEPAGNDSTIDRRFVWTGNTDLLLALIKNVEDCMNAPFDTRRARVRVIIVVEDSPHYSSSLLPMLYKEVVTQTNAVIEESLNEEHRILRMRARPKIILAQSFEQAVRNYNKYKPYLLSIFSDVRFPKAGVVDAHAGFKLLSAVKEQMPNVPLLMLSAEEENRDMAAKIPAEFLNKNSPNLLSEIRTFLQEHLGFGPFIFQEEDGTEIGRAYNTHEMEIMLPAISDESIWYHAVRHHFSRWLMARSEIQLAAKLRAADAGDFSGPGAIKQYLIDCIRERKKGRQRGVVTDFIREKFDPDMDFLKIGKGSLGGKARGLAFISTLLKNTSSLRNKFPGIVISVPKSLVISTESFDAFMNLNGFKASEICEKGDTAIRKMYLAAELPERLMLDLRRYLADVRYPIAVRSSSLLEDAQYQARAGIYMTYMTPNNDPDIDVRLRRLADAIKLVYGSTYMESAVTFSRSTHQRTEEEKMGVVIQKLTGVRYGDLFFPALSGVAQSYNFYPISYMKPEEGIVHVAAGLGRTVVEGGTAMRFSPGHPQFLPHLSSVDDILKHSQRLLYALDMKHSGNWPASGNEDTLLRLEIDDPRVAGVYPLRLLCSTYDPNDHRIRDGAAGRGYKVLTFASILKYNMFPLAEVVSEILEMGRKGMGGPVEIEYAVNLFEDPARPAEFDLLQVRPMVLNQKNMMVEITDDDIREAVCFSTNALGNGIATDIADIVTVDPKTFDPSQTIKIAQEIDTINKEMIHEGRKYLLIGPGRWGSADRWLGVPVAWNNISNVGAIIEASLPALKANPSQGSHFFNNITSLGISYITISETSDDFIDWDRIMSWPSEKKTRFLWRIRCKQPMVIKVDGKQSKSVILENGS